MIYFNDYLDKDSLTTKALLSISLKMKVTLDFPSGGTSLNMEKVDKYINMLVEMPNAGPPNQNIDSFDLDLSEDRFQELAEILIDQEISKSSNASFCSPVHYYFNWSIMWDKDESSSLSKFNDEKGRLGSYDNFSIQKTKIAPQDPSVKTIIKKSY